MIAGRCFDDLDRRMSTKRCNVSTAVMDQRATIGVPGIAMMIATEEASLPRMIRDRPGPKVKSGQKKPKSKKAAAKAPPAPPSPKKHKPAGVAKGPCFDFNGAGCTRPQCRFTHECALCGSTDHGQEDCA